MSNTAKVCWCLSCMDENQLITDVEFFHWLRPVFCLIDVLMLSRSFLLIRPISLLAGLIRNFTPHGRYELNKLTSLPMCGP